MEQLPQELLERVLMYLPTSDRLHSALTCRRWAQAVSSPLLLEDICLRVEGCDLNSFMAAMIGSQRQYRNLEVSTADLSTFEPEFWRRIGRNLHYLKLYECRWVPQVLFGILQECVELKSLRIGCLRRHDANGKKSLTDFELPEGISLENIRNSLTNVRHLHLDFFLAPEILTHLLNLMPNVRTVAFSGFEQQENLVQHVLSSLGPNRVITDLRLDLDPHANENLIGFVRASSASLIRIRVSGLHFTRNFYEAICDCTQLRSVYLEQPEFYFGDDHLKMLLLKCPDLEILELLSFRKLTKESLVAIFEHRALEVVALTCCHIKRRGEFQCRDWETSKLRAVILRETRVSVELLRNLARLPNLRRLNLDFLRMNPECISIFFENFKNLESLRMMNCHKLSDENGMKIRRLENLKSLIIRKGKRLTDATFRNGVGSADMESLEVEECALTDSGLASIASHHSRLRNLVIDDAKKITYDGVASLLQNEPLLERLGLSDTRMRRKESQTSVENLFDTLEKSCPRLRRLGTKWILTPRDVHRVRALRPRVRLVSSV